MRQGSGVPQHSLTNQTVTQGRVQGTLKAPIKAMFLRIFWDFSGLYGPISARAEQFCIRHNHVCRQVCSEIGQWSVVWAKCTVAWHLHVTRSGLYASLLNSVFRIRDDNWLQHRRSHFVPSNGDISTRRSIRAGNLGTRVYVGYV